MYSVALTYSVGPPSGGVVYVRASKRSHNCQSNSKGAQVALFRRAWNAFIRLLDIYLLSSFQCPICGPCPDTVVCDGTMLGFRKDLLPLCIPTQQNDEALTLTGTKHEQRIRSPKCRELLLKFTGITRDRKRMPSPKYILHVLCIFNYSEAASQ